MNKLNEFSSKLDWKLKLFPVVLILLACGSYFVLVSYLHPTSHPYFISLIVLASVTIALILSVLIFSLFLICLTILYAPIQSRSFEKYLKTIKQDASAKVAIILGYPNWYHFNGWYKTNFTKREIEFLFKYLERQGKSFFVYPHASSEDVERIMADPNIREVFFCGHGDSHVFKLSTDKIVFYCDFKDAKYKKDLVHQVHCGTPDGKNRRLIDFVVPPENRDQCFYFPKLIYSSDIRNWFKERIKALG